MSKFKKGGSKGVPAVSTASLPDIVFMLLFFFMVSTTMKETPLKVGNSLPEISEIKKMENKSLTSYIYVGTPIKSYQASLGKKDHVQLNGRLYKADEVSEIQPFIIEEREKRKEHEIPKMRVSIKSDVNVKNGIIIDIEEQLKKVEAYKINYSSKKAKNSN